MTRWCVVMSCRYDDKVDVCSDKMEVWGDKVEECGDEEVKIQDNQQV